MKKIDLGQTITILANLGVIAGIMFLAIELQQNNELLEAEANRAFVTNRISMNMARGEDGLATAFVKGINGEPLSAVEQFKLEQYYSAAMAAWEWEYAQFTVGNLEIEFDNWRLAYSSWPGFSVFWEEQRARRKPEFVEFYDANIAN